MDAHEFLKKNEARKKFEESVDGLKALADKDFTGLISSMMMFSKDMYGKGFKHGVILTFIVVIIIYLIVK
jgi:hypothetical protein